MKSLHKSVLIWYSPQQMFDVVTDVARYHEFLPGCHQSAVVERTSEIGTLRAIGLRRSGIRSIFICEGLVLGCLGAAIGIVASLGAAVFINSLELTWVPPGRIEQVPLAVRLVGEHAMLLGSAVCLVAVAAISALVPAARASRMVIVDALRHV